MRNGSRRAAARRPPGQPSTRLASNNSAKGMAPRGATSCWMRRRGSTTFSTFSTFSTFFTVSIAISAASHCHHPVITGHRLPSSPYRHRHPVITFPSTSPSCHRCHRDGCDARCAPPYQPQSTPSPPLSPLITTPPPPSLTISPAVRYPVIPPGHPVRSSPSRHHRPVTTIPSSPSRHHHPVTTIPSSSHPVITIPSSPSRHQHPGSPPSPPARGADLLGVEPRISGSTALAAYEHSAHVSVGHC